VFPASAQTDGRVTCQAQERPSAWANACSQRTQGFHPCAAWCGSGGAALSGTARRLSVERAAFFSSPAQFCSNVRLFGHRLTGCIPRSLLAARLIAGRLISDVTVACLAAFAAYLSIVSRRSQPPCDTRHETSPGGVKFAGASNFKLSLKKSPALSAEALLSHFPIPCVLRLQDVIAVGACLFREIVPRRKMN